MNLGTDPRANHCVCRPHVLPLVAVALAFAACSADTPSTPTGTHSPSAVAPNASVPVATVVTVYRSPLCSCCHEYEAYLRTVGYTVETVDLDDTSAWKTEHGIPPDARSCHTTAIDGYLVEGHVPLAAIADLLEDKPAIKGISLPAMPPGSPGMPGPKGAPFEVLAIGRDGSLSPFGSY